MEFNLYDLLNYVYAESNIKEVIQEHDEQRTLILDNVFPEHFADNGNYVTSQRPTEDTAIELIALSETRDKKINRLRRKAEKFNQALNTLSEKELKAIKLMLWGHDYELFNSDLYLYYEKAKEKVFSYLEQTKTNELKEIEEQRKADIKAYRERNKRKNIGELMGVK